MNRQQKILFRAEKLLHCNELLIKQCDSWLPAEEGNKNMMERIMGKKTPKGTESFKIFGINRKIRNL